MLLPNHKTKIVATIGPASESPEMLESLIRAGLNVARLNFSHGDFSSHAERITRIRAAEKATGRRVAIMADLPGPKMRVGKIEPEPIQLRPGESFTLTSEDIIGNTQRVSMSFERLPQVVKPGELMVQLDDREQRAKLAQAEADYAGALATAGEKGRVGQSEAQLAAARAQVAQADANAIRGGRDLARTQIFIVIHILDIEVSGRERHERG